MENEKVAVIEEEKERNLNETLFEGAPYEAEPKAKFSLKTWWRGAWSTIRHTAFNIIKVAVNAFKKKQVFTNDTVEHDGHTLGNGQKIFIGGTKPMTKYTDEQGKEYLFKEAVNAIGQDQPQSAYLTEAGARLQAIVDPSTAVNAFVGATKDTGFGSFQERIDVAPKEQSVDLFKWQYNPEWNRGRVQKLVPQIMKEHATDWLLCNYDTKGENFLVDTSGRLRGIDKEQAFKYIFDKGSEHMSSTYQPNPHQTLYNVVFQEYEKGNLNINFNDSLQYVKKIEALSDKDYIKNFDKAIETRCVNNPEKEQLMRKNILDRKNNLRDEYREFFTKLSTSRNDLTNIKEDGRFHFADELDANGKVMAQYLKNNEPQKAAVNEHVAQQTAHKLAAEKPAETNRVKVGLSDLTNEKEKAAPKTSPYKAKDKAPIVNEPRVK